MDRTESFNKKKYLVMRPRQGSTPRQTDWVTVSRNVTLTWLWLCITSHFLKGTLVLIHGLDPQSAVADMSFIIRTCWTSSLETLPPPFSPSWEHALVLFRFIRVKMAGHVKKNGICVKWNSVSNSIMDRSHVSYFLITEIKHKEQTKYM
jgi:hypothetical protein